MSAKNSFVIIYSHGITLFILDEHSENMEFDNWNFGQFGYRVYSLVHSFRQFALNLPFAIYILSPSISSYIVLKKNSRITGFREWLKTVFETRNKSFVYFIIFAGLVLYFGMHIAISGRMEMALPFYMFFLSLPGNLFIGGLEEAGWTYALQPGMDQRYGFVLSSILVGAIWIFWHIPLFFIPGTSHCEGLIDFWMFNVQVMSLSFFSIDRWCIQQNTASGNVTRKIKAYDQEIILPHLNRCSSQIHPKDIPAITTVSAGTATHAGRAVTGTNFL